MPDVNSSGSTPPIGGTESGSVHTLLGADRTRIVLFGDIDISLSEDLTAAVADAERAGMPTEVDARNVTFMDSSGIALLARLASRTPGRLALIQPPDAVRFLLEVTKIGEMVDVIEQDPGFADRRQTDAAPRRTPPDDAA